MAEYITLEGEATQLGYANVPNTFKINMCGMNVSKLMVSFEGPAKPEVMLTSQRDGTVDCTYRTIVEGEYTINVTFDEEHVIGSPSKTQVKGELIVDTSKVKVTGAGLKEGKNRQLNTVTVDPKEAKITSQLQVYMEGTSKPDVSYRNNDNGTSTVTYKPYTIGEYKLHLKYMDQPVPGSPFTLKVKN
ncbi:filamin-B [Folsomia candida]|uniref:filamin-B n=1 Tax=Folsomia candida TaxID=158441 RepID=UPI000B8F2ED0|nr:filamin-B [Folsomia candida]